MTLPEENFAQYFSAVLKNLGHSQVYLAALANIHPTRISKVKNGSLIPDKGTVAAWAKCWGISSVETQKLQRLLDQSR